MGLHPTKGINVCRRGVPVFATVELTKLTRALETGTFGSKKEKALQVLSRIDPENTMCTPKDRAFYLIC